MDDSNFFFSINKLKYVVKLYSLSVFSLLTSFEREFSPITNLFISISVRNVDKIRYEIGKHISKKNANIMPTIPHAVLYFPFSFNVSFLSNGTCT